MEVCNMAKIKAILFDFDGTLANTNGVVLESWKHVYEFLKMPLPQDTVIFKTFGENLEESFEKAFPNQNIEKLLKVYRTYMQEIFCKKVTLFDGMGELIKTLKEQGYKLGIVTSRYWSMLKEMGYDCEELHLMDTIISGDEVKEHKPHPMPCLKAIENLKVLPNEAIMVGDSSLDILCGKNAGLFTVLVAWSVCCKKEDAKGDKKPDFVIEKPKELLSILEKF